MAKRKGLVGLVGLAVALLMSVLALAPAGAQTDGGASGNDGSGGTTTGTSDPQSDANNVFIECSWAAADYNDDWRDYMQYDTGRVPGWGDDDPKNPGYPCDIKEKGTPPVMDDGVGPMIQVLPNAEDYPTEKYVELWAAVEYPLGIQNVTQVIWHVYHPDGTLKVQIHGDRATPLDPGSRLEHCEGPEGMFYNAYLTGQLSAAAIDDPNTGMKILCREYIKDYWYGAFGISKHQPCGIYYIQTTAIGAPFTAHVDELGFSIEVLCFYNLELDFDTVNFGDLRGGATHIVAGNVKWGDGVPSVKNTGNSGMGVKVAFSRMCNTNPDVLCNGYGKYIDTFDAAFGVPHRGNLDYRYPVPGTAEPGKYHREDVVRFSPAYEHTLCPNDVGKLDLSVHPPVGLFPGDYYGSIFVWGYSNPICDTDYGSVYNANGYKHDPYTAPWTTGYWAHPVP